MTCRVKTKIDSYVQRFQEKIQTIQQTKKFRTREERENIGDKRNYKHHISLKGPNTLNEKSRLITVPKMTFLEYPNKV